MAIDIAKGIEPFEDQTDFSRNNPDRKTFGRSGNDGLNTADDWTTNSPTVTPVIPPVVPPPDPPVAAKFTHKLSNGTVLEASTMEEMAALIEKAVTQQAPPATLDFEDKPLYQPYEFKPKDLSLQEQADILNMWKENPQKAKRMLDEADLGAPASVIIGLLKDTQQVLRMKLEEEAGADFLGDCETYNATPANGKKLGAYLREKGKPITKQNLLVAFRQLSETDKTMIRKVDDIPPSAPPVDDGLQDQPPPPVIVPSNQGRPEAPPAADVAKLTRDFAAMSLKDQQAYFASIRRRA